MITYKKILPFLGLVVICSVYVPEAQEIGKALRTGWTPWSRYGPCSALCGVGRRIRTRVCRTGRCNGLAWSVKQCRNLSCSRRGGWSSWTKFGRCSKKCGEGVMVRRRNCLGRKCLGSSYQTKKCYTRCRSTVFGNWGPWSKASPCTKTCGGGTTTRIRQCKYKACKGPGIIRSRCSATPCPGKWGKWSKFGPCTKSCGGGVHTRRRTCRTKNCIGRGFSTRQCNTKICLSNWTACTKTCGTGTQYKFDFSFCQNVSNSKCFRTFRECNVNECSPKECLPGSELRYGSTSACCSTETNRRIIYGTDADLNMWKWMVLLKIHSSSVCGGSLLSSKWIVTAGHCLDELGVSGVKGLRIYIGIRKYSERLTATTHVAEEIHKHPKYKGLEYDVGLVKLAKEVDLFSDKIKIISLPNGELTPTDSTCFTAGWGLTHPNQGTVTEDLLQVDVQVLDNAVCHKSYRNNTEVGDYVLTTQNLLCAGSLSRKNDACTGDSGGPLVCQRCSSCGWYLAGITSFGPAGDCGKPGHPGMYSRVSKFENWIHDKIPSLKPAAVSECGYAYGP